MFNTLTSNNTKSKRHSPPPFSSYISPVSLPPLLPLHPPATSGSMAAPVPPPKPKAMQTVTSQAQAPPPTIRLISATPSTTFASSNSNCSTTGSDASSSFHLNRSLEEHWANLPPIPSSAAAPTTGTTTLTPKSRKKLVPKKSKLSLLPSLSSSSKEKSGKDLSDVIRRVGVPSSNGNFEVYIDRPREEGDESILEDEDVGEIVVVRKKKSRVALDGMVWGESQKLGEITNVPKVKVKSGKGDENAKESGKEGGGGGSGRWWTIGRGRKDSKEDKDKKEKEKLTKLDSWKPVEYIHPEPARSKTPEPFKSSDTNTQSRGRFNSLGANVLFSSSPTPPVTTTSGPTPPASISRSASPIPPSLTIGGLLAPPNANVNGGGSIALRAIRSVKSLARMGTWAGAGAGGEDGNGVREGTIKEKKKSTARENKDGTIKRKKKGVVKEGEGEGEGEREGVKKTKSTKSKGSTKSKSKSSKSKDKDKETIRLSTSSFEAGHLSASPQPLEKDSKVEEKVEKKKSILGLGLGLPSMSSMRLPSVRHGSGASSLLFVPGQQNGGFPSPTLASSFISSPAPAAPASSARLSIDSCHLLNGRDPRPSSIISSTASSLRPLSLTSTHSGISRSVSGSSRSGVCSSSRISSSGSSIRWDEQGIRTSREMRRKEREEKGSVDGGSRRNSGVSAQSGLSGHSLEGRRRTSLKDVFPELGSEVEEEDEGEGEAMDVDVRSADGDSMDVDEVDDNDNASTDCSQSYTSSVRIRRKFNPILRVEEATNDGHGDPDLQDHEDEDEKRKAFVELTKEKDKPATPTSKRRARPMSEQLLGKSRPRAMCEDEDGVISILSAATNDLALLINTLDLQATPGTTPGTGTSTAANTPIPLDQLRMPELGDFSVDSPLRRLKPTSTVTAGGVVERMLKNQASIIGAASHTAHTLPTRGSMASISSLRPYAQSRGYAPKTAPLVLKKKPSTQGIELGAQIAPWPVPTPPASSSKLSSAHTSTLSPASPSLSASASSTGTITRSTFRKGHKRTMTPGPEPDPEPVLQALAVRPTKHQHQQHAKKPSTPLPSPLPTPGADEVFGTIRGKGPLPTLGSSSEGEGEENDESFREGEEGDVQILSVTRSAMLRGGSGSLTPVFKKMQEEREREDRYATVKRSSLAPADYHGRRPCPSPVDLGASTSTSAYADSFSLPLARETKRQLGMRGTLGGSYGGEGEGEVESDDPDSDVPDELKFILKAREMSEDGSDDEVGSGREDEDEEEEDERIHQMMLGSVNPRVGVIGGRVFHMEEDQEEFEEQEEELRELPLFKIDATSTTGAEEEMITFNTTAAALARCSLLSVPSAPSSPGQNNHTSTSYLSTTTTSSSLSSEEDTKKSFDFTGELRALNSSSSLSNRISFVEQLENAFRTPAKVDLRFGGVVVEVPGVPVPMIPVEFRVRRDVEGSRVEEEEGESEESSVGMARGGSGRGGGDVSMLVDMTRPSSMESTRLENSHPAPVSLSSSLPIPSFSTSQMQLVNVKEPSRLFVDESKSNSGDMVLDDLSSSDGGRRLMPMPTRSPAVSICSNKSTGELDRSFRFGGLPSSRSGSNSLSSSTASSKANGKDKEPLTLSDIIPSPSHARSISEGSFSLDGDEAHEDDSVLKSIYAKLNIKDDLTTNSEDSNDSVPPMPSASLHQRQSVYSYKAASRPVSGVSFAGFDSFDEVRRGFEFSGDRSWYPPSNRNGVVPPVPSLPLPSLPPAQVHAQAQPRIPAGRNNHKRDYSVFSIASVSSYGHVLNHGIPDPFDYGLPPMPCLRERPSSEDMTNASATSVSMSMEVDDTFAYLRDMPHRRKRVESDASSFYFRSGGGNGRQAGMGHRRKESNFSVSSFQAPAPPVSLHNRSFAGHHRRDDSNASLASISVPIPGGRQYQHQHRRDMSVDSMQSDFSSMMDRGNLARPGIGDKMFEQNRSGMLGPLTSIDASPDGPDGDSRSYSQAYSDDAEGTYDYYDSILDVDPSTSRIQYSGEDSLFNQTTRRSEGGDDSVFGHGNGSSEDGYARVYGAGGRLLPPHQFRPLSVVSLHSVHSPQKEDDTMISMIGGGQHVRRRSIRSLIDASPCPRVEKRKHSQANVASKYEVSPNKARIVEKPSIASTAEYHFGADRMIRAQNGRLLERQSLEESVLVGDGEEEGSGSFSIPVFTRPIAPGARSRSSTCTSSSSGADTPPLSASSSDGASFSEASPQSSVDLSHINMKLSNATHPVQNPTFGFGRPRAQNNNNNSARTRARERGAGHRRRYSKAHVSMSRSSVYETIEEESTSPLPPMKKQSGGASPSPTQRQAVFIVDPDTASLQGDENRSGWDDERGIVALRKYYALRDEVEVTVEESRRMWLDTPFSVFAVQTFQPPANPSGMQALLEHSVQNYGPLPSELRPRRVRSRTSSRASPYPQSRVNKASVQHQQQMTWSAPPSNDLHSDNTPPAPAQTQAAPAPRSILRSVFNPNFTTSNGNHSSVIDTKSGKTPKGAPSLDALKPFSPLILDVNSPDVPLNNDKSALNIPRPRVGSNARRTALGWSKRSNGPKTSTGPAKENSNTNTRGSKSSSGAQKENQNAVATAVGSGGAMMTPGATLRLNRPRPKGRATPASVARPIRI